VYFEVTNVILDDAYFRMFNKSPLNEFSHAHVECTFTKARGAVFIDLRECSCYFPQFGQKIPHFGSGSLAINARRMHFHGVDVSSATTTITTNGTIRFKPEVYLDLHFVADPLDVGEVAQGVFDDPLDFYGHGRYSGSLVGPTDDLRQEGRLTLDRGYIAGYELENLFADYVFDIPGRSIRVTGLETRVNDMPASMEMTLDYSGDKPAYWGEVRFLSVNLAEFVKNKFLTTDVDCRLAFNGTGLTARDYDINATAYFGAGKLGPLVADGGTADLRYTAGRADISGLSLRVGDGVFFLKGRGDQTNLDLRINAQRVPLDRLRFDDKPLEARGAATFEGHVFGEHNSPSFEGELTLNDFETGAFSCAGLWVKGYLKELGPDQQGVLRAGFWEGKLGPIACAEGSGDVALDHGVYLLTAGRLQTSGGAEASFDLGYDTRAERLELSRLDLTLRQGEAHLTAPLVFGREGPQFRLGGGVLAYATGELAVGGTYTPASGALDMVAEARRIPLDDFIPPEKGLAVTGTLNRLRLDVTGTTADPELYANLAASNLVINGQPLDFLHGEASYADEHIVVPGITAGLAGGTVTATAYVPLSVFDEEGTAPLDATLWFSHFKLDTFNVFFKDAVVDGGYMDGVVTASGTAASPVVRGNLLLREIRRGDLYFARGRADFTYQDGAVELREVSLAEADLPNLLVRGRVPVKAAAPGETPEGLVLYADLVDLDLRLINAFTDEVLITGGEARGEIRIGGSADRPEIEGRLTLMNGEGVSRALRSSFARFSGDVVAHGNELAVAADNPLTFRLDEGGGTLWGRAVLQGTTISELDISVDVTGYVIRALSGVQAMGNLKANLAGSPEHLRVTASVDLTSGLITTDFGETGGATPSAGGTALDYEVHIVAPGNLWLRNKSANIELEADVTARRVNGVTTYTGLLQARRGYYYFLQRDFTVARADISFTGTEQLDPILDLEATRTIHGMKADSYPAVITIHVTGTLREPVIELSYESGGAPVGLTQDEILILLALDITKEDYDELSSDVIASKESVDYLRRYAEAEVARAVRAGTGLEVFQMDSNLLSGAQEQPFAEVTVGQHLTAGLYVSYTGRYEENTPGTSSLTHAAEVDYELRRDFYLVGSTYEDAGSQHYGLGVRFMKKY
jgi:autotransporter translocation and assembly factor TamB